MLPCFPSAGRSSHLWGAPTFLSAFLEKWTLDRDDAYDFGFVSKAKLATKRGGFTRPASAFDFPAGHCGAEIQYSNTPLAVWGCFVNGIQFVTTPLWLAIHISKEFVGRKYFGKTSAARSPAIRNWNLL